ncbi:D-lyxose/D-mannose family sugar isomerase [Shewanella sp. 0m-11]
MDTQIKDILTLSGIYLTTDEVATLEITDFGLGEFDRVGLIIHTYVNTPRCCAKELIILPHQICPEHLHPTIAGVAGKEETFRCRFGKVSIFIAGVSTSRPSVSLPTDLTNYTVFHEVILEIGDQLTLQPDAKHWFKAHEEGAVVSEFSTTSNDELDLFTNQKINRASRVPL